jgi:hypothetical protein
MLADRDSKGAISVQQQGQRIPWQQWIPGGVTYIPGQRDDDDDNDQEWNIQEEGGPLSAGGWSRWTKLPTGATTDTPAPVRFDQDLHLFVRGTDKSICDTAERPSAM